MLIILASGGVVMGEHIHQLVFSVCIMYLDAVNLCVFNYNICLDIGLYLFMDL